MSRASLRGVEMKMSRAQEHLRTLVVATNRFLADPKTYSAVFEVNKQRRPVLLMDSVKEPPPGWGILIGDCTHNLRSALDHLAFQLMVANSPRPLRRKHIKTSAFPVFLSGNKFRQLDKRGMPARGSGLEKIDGVSGTAKTILESLQPYHRRKNPDTRSLWELEELWNGDKHRLLPLIHSSFELRELRIDANLPFALTGFESVPGRLKKGAVIARWNYVAAPYPIRVHVDFHMVTDIAFGKGTLVPYPVRGRRVIETIYGALRFIAKEVVPPLAEDMNLPFNFRLGELVLADERSPRTLVPSRRRVRPDHG